MTIAQSDRLSRSFGDHVRIIVARERRDARLVEELVRQHSPDLVAFVETSCDFLN